MSVDEMERMPHKRPDDALAKVAARFEPRISMFIAQADTLGEDVFQDEHITAEFRKYRIAYEEALGECFDTYFSASELPEDATEQDKFNARENFVRQTAELNENEAIQAFAAHAQQGKNQAEIDAHAMRLETHFGTLRNGYLREAGAAEEQKDSWVSSIRGPKTPRGKA